MNESAMEELRTLCAWIELTCSSIDKKTVADPTHPDAPPDWWLAMRRLQDEAYRCKCALPVKETT